MRQIQQTGYTLIEVMIALAIIGLLVAFAVTSFSQYVQRSRVSGGVYLASTVKLAVSEYYSNNNKLPDSNSEAAIAAAKSINSKDVRSIGIEVVPSSGTITIAYKASGSIADGDTVLLVPLKYHDTLLWKCESNTMINGLLPSSCR